MIDWPQVKPELIALFSALAVPPKGSQPFQAQWRNRALVSTSDVYKADLFLRITSVVGIGNDDTRRRVLRDTGGNVTSVEHSVTGPRRIIMRVEAHSTVDTDSESASNMLERIRTGLRVQSSTEALQSVKLSVTKIGAALDVPYVKNGHSVPRVAMDVTLVGVANYIDTIPGGWFEKIELTSHLRGENNVELPPPGNVVAKQIP